VDVRDEALEEETCDIGRNVGAHVEPPREAGVDLPETYAELRAVECVRGVIDETGVIVVERTRIAITTERAESNRERSESKSQACGTLGCVPEFFPVNVHVPVSVPGDLDE
jgi:hypothetical protein